MRYPRFIRWLERQPADRRYDYCNPGNCGYARYLRSWGCLAIVSPKSWIGLWLGVIPCGWRVPPEIDTALICSPHTYGAALERMRG